jgi:hypothetical protein
VLPSVNASMAKAAKMRQEYDFSSGVRGKYLPPLAKGANVVVLDRDQEERFVCEFSYPVDPYYRRLTLPIPAPIPPARRH